MDANKLDEAVPLYEEGIRIREATVGEANPLTAALIESLALVRLKLGQLDEAVALLRRALAIHTQAYGADHYETIESHRNLVVAFLQASRHDEAIPHLREVVVRDVDPQLHVDLDDPAFDAMRTMPAFRALVEEVRQRAVRSAMR